MTYARSTGMIMYDDGTVEPNPLFEDRRRDRAARENPDEEWRKQIENKLANMEAKIDLMMKHLQDINTTVKNLQAAGIRMVTHQGRHDGDGGPYNVSHGGGPGAF